MSQPQPAPTYEGILALFQKTDERIDRMFQDTAKQMKDTDERIDRMFRDTDERIDKKFQETAKQIEETNKQIEATSEQLKATQIEVGRTGSRIGEIVECMVGGGKIVAQFKALGHNIITHSRNKHFGDEGTADSGEFDLYLENGDIAIFIEVKTKLSSSDVKDHIERLEKYRKWIETKGGDKRQFIGAVAGAVVERHVAKFALKKGLYVIVQTGVDTEIITPTGFVPTKW